MLAGKLNERGMNMNYHRSKPSVFPKKLNSEGTLYEVNSSDVWQAELISNDGISVGRVIREVIDPSHYAVRYLIVNLLQIERLVLVPAVSVTGAEEGAIFCNLKTEELYNLPEFVTEEITKQYEHEIFESISRSPYWSIDSSDGSFL
jgi:hypothetical protein